MSFLPWNNLLSVEVNTIDTQHKRLVNLVNDLHDAMNVGRGKDIMDKTFAELVDYTKTHFATEETLMKTHSYPGYLDHKREHDDLTQQVLQHHQDYLNGKSTVTIQLMMFLSDWLKKHILNTDKKLGAYLKGKGID